MQRVHLHSAIMDLTPPGEIFRADFRPNPNATSASSSETIKLLQWNIERGYKLEGIIEELKSINADIISLQEVDVGCERTGSINTGEQRLPYQGCFFLLSLFIIISFCFVCLDFLKIFSRSPNTEYNVFI